MNKPVKRYDCTSGGAQWCQGCYTMDESEHGDWVSAEDYDALAARVAKLGAALRQARLFIVNGVDLGFIRMPDADTPDPAHDVLPMIDAALSAKPN